jgi:steroid 5-alpha reductase family enzyme
MNPLWLLLISAMLLTLLFAGTWRFGIHCNNYSIVDAAWALSFSVVALLFALGGSGWPLRRTVIAIIIIIWSLRLGIYLSLRIMNHHPEEDLRYDVLRKRWQDQGLQKKFFGFFMAQALLVWLLMLPVYFICNNNESDFAPLEIAGVCLWIIGLWGEAIADRQLKKFKRKNATRPQSLCKEGLWKYSRHPNYFFQSLLWWGLFLCTLPIQSGWIAILAPLAMLYFILRVTGIPLTEELALKKRGAAYRAYQQTTSAFIPLPPKKHQGAPLS